MIYYYCLRNNNIFRFPLSHMATEEPKKKKNLWLYEIGVLRVSQGKDASHYEIFHKDSLIHGRGPVSVRVRLGSNVDRASCDIIIPDEYLNADEARWLIECLKLGEEVASYSNFVALVELIEKMTETNMDAKVKTFFENKHKERKEEEDEDRMRKRLATE
jgi:hypothetical protein